MHEGTSVFDGTIKEYMTADVNIQNVQQVTKWSHHFSSMIHRRSLKKLQFDKSEQEIDSFFQRNVEEAAGVTSDRGAINKQSNNFTY